MIASGALFSRESSSPATLLFRLLFLALVAACITPAASAQYRTYPIYTNVSSVPAGSYGAAIVASVNDASLTANFNVCFDTGYGSSKVPIVPSGYVNYGDFAQFNFVVPAATIQAVPPTAFVNGSFNVSIYSIPQNFSACNGNEGGATQGNTVTLNYPVLQSVSLPYLPEQNAALTAREPSSLALTGSNFINNSGTMGTVPSTVNFSSSNTLAGAVSFISNYSLVSTIPTTIPAAASSVNIQVCNTATYSYCSNTLTLKTAALQQDPGTLTATPSPALTTQTVTLTANFGPAQHSVAGAPSGLVTFGDWGMTLGTAPLVLDKTATLVEAPTQQFLVYAPPIAPIVADFNRDGVPDTLFIDPGTGNSGASLNLLLGTVPDGSFSGNHQFYVINDGPSFTISSAAVGDFNGDGIPDIVLLATEPGYTTNPTIYTMLGNGDGTFQDGFSSSPALYGSQIVAGDFNKDGKQDIVIAGALDGNQTIGLQTLLGDGKGNFTTGPATTGLRTAPSPYFGDFKVVAADFNADGYPDVAVMNGYSPEGQLDNSIELYQNNGKGVFLAPVRVQTDGTATADFSVAALGPGKPLDILVTSTASQYPGVDVALNQSTTAKIAFFSTFQYTQVPGITQAVAGDFDGDGFLDIAVDDGKTIHVLSGNGFGAFTAAYPDLSIVPPGTSLIAASDENGDKYADLLLYTVGTQDGNTRYPITLYDYVTAGTATAIFPPTTFAAGTHTVHASTNGTFDILAGSATATLIVTAPTPSTVTLTASPATPASYGTVLVKLTATIPAGGVTGTMSFYNGTSLLGTAPVVDQTYSTATFTTAILPAGTYSFKAVYGGDTTHGSGTSALVPYVINPIAATLAWKPNPATIVYGTPLSAAQLNATATGITGAAVAGAFTYAPALGTILAVGTHPVVATFKPTDTNYTSSTITQNIIVTQATPTVTWKPNPATIVYGTPLSAAQLNATASAPGTFVYTPALGTVLAVGTHTLSTTFTPTDTLDFTPVTTTTTIVVTIATPVISWTPNPATIPYGTALSAAQLEATSSTPGTFVYTPALGTVLAAGTQTLTAVFTPKDSTDFKTVTTTTTIVVTSVAPTIAWTPNPATIPYGTALSAAQLDATSSTPGTFVYTPALGTVLAAGTQTLTAVFTPKDSTDFKTVTTTTTIVVTSVAPTIAWTPNPATIPYGTALSAAQLDATSSTPGTFVYTPALGTVLAAGTQTLTAVFTPKDSTDFKTVTTTTTIVVTSVAPTIAWTPNPATIPYGTALSAAQLDATSSTPGSFTYTPALGTVLTAGAQTLSVIFTPTDTLNFKSQTSTANINVTQATPVITWAPNPATIIYGTALSAAQLDATSSTPGIFTYTPALGTILNAGAQTISVLFTPKDAVDFTSVTQTATITVTAATPTVTWVPNPATIIYGTPLSAAQLDATSSLPGTYTYSPANGAVLTAGTQTLNLRFQPSDANYSAVNLTRTITVAQAKPVLTWATPADINLGTALSATQLDATAAGVGGLTLPGTFTYTPAAGTVLPVGPNTLSVLFTPADSVDYTTATASVVQAVGLPATVTRVATSTGSSEFGQPVTFTATTVAGTNPATGTTNFFDGTNLIGSSTTSPATLTVSTLTAGTHSIVAAFVANNSFAGSTSAALAQKVTAAVTTITWAPNPATITFNTPLSASQLDATVATAYINSVPGVFAYTPALGTVLNAGAQTLKVTFTPTDTLDYLASTGTALVTVTTIDPVVTWTPNPATITYGTALTASQLDATSVLPGTYTYSPANGAILGAGLQTLTLRFQPTSPNYNILNLTRSITVTQAAPVIAWTPNPATMTYGTALSAAQLDATSSTPGTFAYTPALGAVLSAGTQTLSVVFTPTETVNYKPVTSTATITVTQTTPTINWLPNPATIAYGTALSGAQLDATSTTPGTFVYSPVLGTVLAAGTQTLTAVFTPSDGTDFKSITTSVNIIVTAISPTINWLPNPATITYGTALSGAQLDATSTTPGTFVYSPALGTVLAAGTQTLIAVFTPTDTTDFKSITTTATVVVTQITPTITWLPNPATIAYGTPLSAAQLDANATTPGTFTYTPATGTVLSAGTQTLSVLFTPTDTINFKSVTATTSITVNAVSPTVTWLPNPATIAYGIGLSAAQLDATSTTPGVFTYTPALGTVLSAGTQTLSVLFTPRDTINFKTVTATATVTVTQAVPTVTWLPNPATVAYETPLSASQLDASSTTAGSFTYAPSLGTILAAGTQKLTAVFTPTDAIDFKSVTATATIVVTSTTPTITWLPNPSTITYGTGLSATQLDATSSTPGTFTYTPPLGTILAAGTQTLSTVFTPTDTVDFKSLTTTATITVSQAKPVLKWTTPAAIVSGTPLSATQLDATASGVDGLALPGTYSYTPAAGTVLPAGTSTLSVLFTPSDAVDYSTATTTVLQSVSLPVTTTVLTSSLAQTQFGQPVTFTAATTSTKPVTGTLSFYDGTTLLGTSSTNPASVTLSTLTAGSHSISAVFAANQSFAGSTSTPLTQTVSLATTSISWTPNPATLPYGNPLSAGQLDATVSTAYQSTVPGTFAYTPALGTVLPAGPQTLKVTFTPTDAVDYLPATGSALVTVTAGTPTITWIPSPATITYGTQLSAAQLDATSSTPGVFTYSQALGSVLPAGVQTLSVLFTPTDTVHFKSVTTTATITVTQATPTVTWLPAPATITYGTGLSVAQLDATATTPGTFTYTPSLGTVLSAGTQTLSAIFTPTDTTDFKSVTATATITVTAVAPTVTWTPNPATISYGTALSAAQLDATATTPGSFAYTPALGTILSAGTQTLSVVFTPKDTPDFKPVTTTTTIVVSAAAPAITWTPNPATITYGTPLSAAQFDATSSTPGTFTYSPALGTVLAAGTQTLSAVFTPTDTTNFKSVTTTATVVVTAIAPTVTWTPSPATISYGTALSAGQLDATATTPGTFTYTPAIGAVLTAGTQTLSVLFTPTDGVNYKPVTATANIVVTAITPTVAWTPQPATISYGTALSAGQLDATSTTPGTFTYTPALGTVLSAGTQTLTSVFTPKDSTNYKSVTSTTTIVVTATTPAITWTPNPATISYGTALSAGQLDATATTPGTFTYTPALGTVLPTGTQTLSVTFAPKDSTDFKSVTSTASITVTAATPAVTWMPNPATITYGTPLSVAQLDASAAAPGTFVYMPALGTVLSAGTQTLSAVFTPADTKDFKTVTATATINVAAATPAVTWVPNPATITYGTPLSAAQLDATAATPGSFVYTPALGTVLTAGAQTLSVTFTPADIKDFKSVTTTTTINVTAATPAVTWLPNPASIAYGTPLSLSQLDASSATPGTFVYTPAIGAVLTAGTQILSAVFTPTDSKNFKSVTTTATINVTQSTPVITWATPASIVVGTKLSSTQLDATSTGVGGAALPGIFTYTPTAGTLLPSGTQTLKVTFTPTDLADYTTATASVSLEVIPVTLTALSTTTAALGDPAKTITLTGTGFVPSAVVQVNGSAIATTFVNATTLTAIIPASNFLVAQTLQISVAEASQGQTTAAIAFVVGAPLASAVLTGPSSIEPGTDTELSFKLINPYPVDLNATFKLAFIPASGLPSDPNVQFAGGGNTFVAVIPANSTATPTVAIQGSTVAGTMTVDLTLEAGGVNVTPPTIQPLIIQAPLAVPGVNSAIVARSGSTLTVTVRGLSNPRDMTFAKFHFTPVPGGSIGTEDVTIDVVPIFTAWYADPASLQYGSTFTYTQTFNLSSDASVVGQVSVTLVNSVGSSQEATTP